MEDTHDIKKQKVFIKEMFPYVSDEEIDRLFISSRDVNIIITKILDGSYKGFTINLKDLARTKIPQKKFNKELYYPELFTNRGVNASSGDIDREKTFKLYSRIQDIKSRQDFCKDKKIREFYTEEKERIFSEIDNLNRKRALMILNKSLQKPNMLDLHGLYTKEALMFVSDYIKVYSPKEIKLVTGSLGNSQSLRPSVINLLKKLNYKVSDDEGIPFIKGVINSNVTFW
ncbi:hypothetical protein P3W45_001253 [Vairimorpha bombi]|jgi:hypothetical protein